MRKPRTEGVSVRGFQACLGRPGFLTVSKDLDQFTFGHC